jgi:hypothetical protein
MSINWLDYILLIPAAYLLLVISIVTTHNFADAIFWKFTPMVLAISLILMAFKVIPI